MATRDELHQLIDRLPEGLVDEMLSFTQFVAKKVQAEAEPGRVTRAEIQAKYGI